MELEERVARMVSGPSDWPASGDEVSLLASGDHAWWLEGDFDEAVTRYLAALDDVVTPLAQGPLSPKVPSPKVP